jgi:soluble lytic murein transglycosylase-like protein
MPAHADCLDEAATYWKVPTTLARAIAMQESTMRPWIVTKNKNGSHDIGLMQINSWWLPKLARYGIQERDLLDACTNAYVGNWILAQNIEKLGLTWDAVGAYNATSPDKRDRYARSVYRQLMAVQAGTTPPLTR